MKKKQKTPKSKKVSTRYSDASKVAFDDCAEEFNEVYGEDFLDEDSYLLDDEEELVMGSKRGYIGIDNGVTGSIGFIFDNGLSGFIETPVFKDKNYTKDDQSLRRIDHKRLYEGLVHLGIEDVLVIIERPMVNPHAFTATKSALRALEATLVVLETIGFEYEYIDSKEWQREFIGSNVMGRDALKEASMRIGIELFPNNTTYIKRHGDADGLLIAEYARRRDNGETKIHTKGLSGRSRKSR